MVVPRTTDDPFDASVAESLPTVAATLVVVALGYAGAHALLLSGGTRTAMVAISVSSAIAYGATWLALRRWSLAKRFAHPVATAMILLALVDTVADLVLARDPAQTSTLLLVAVGSGVVLLSMRWLLVVLYLVWSGWVIAVVLVGPSRGWAHYLAAMLGATALALAANRLRRTQVRDAAASAAEAEAAAVRDGLTGVANRRGLAMVGNKLVEQARRQGDAVHCIFVDIDGFKAVNDSLGHEAGDRVLVEVARALREVTRATDVVARWGGDEFCVVGPGPGMAPLELERRVRDTVAATAPVPEAVWPARVTAGGAMLEPWDSGNLETLLGKADQEMYLRRSLRRGAVTPLGTWPGSRPGAGGST